MKQNLRLCLFPLLLAATLLASPACKKQPAEEAPPPHFPAPKPLASQIVLHKDFAVRTTVAFPFEMPAHAATPHLRGTYKSFVTKLGIQSNPDSANVDFLVFTEDQYADFAQGATGSSIFSVDSSHDQAVDVGLPPSLNEPRKFYLVFRNTPGGEAKKVVQADLSLDF
jgi:hypothetical protein